MPSRSRLEDLLRSNRFWLVDVIPSSTFPFFVLGAPFMGFQSITMPEITLNTDESKQVNSMYPFQTYIGANVSPITLTRGCRVYDDTFYQWVQRAIRGIDMNPRNLLLIQYTDINLSTYTGASVEMPVAMEAWEVAQFLPGRAWLLWDAIPVRYKAGTDLDGTSGEVSIMELDIAIHAVTEFALLSVT